MTATDAWTYASGGAARDVTGYEVEALDGDVGRVSEASDDLGASYIVVHTGPSTFGRTVVVPTIAIDRVDHRRERVFLNRTTDEIRNAPERRDADDADDVRRRLAARDAGRAAG